MEPSCSGFFGEQEDFDSLFLTQKTPPRAETESDGEPEKERQANSQSHSHVSFSEAEFVHRDHNDSLDFLLPCDLHTQNLLDEALYLLQAESTQLKICKLEPTPKEWMPCMMACGTLRDGLV